ncbi:TOMM precursor leader peptide-binding protein [Plantibacter flavus]|uniref:TOMM precursor leader peptide-binding protein n=1 Tax=Plantibacter flavus TaxID=150123 RepID=UPI003F184A51
MTKRLDPSRPVLWRTPHSLQIGVDDPVVLDRLDSSAEHLVAALRNGYPAAVESRLATTFGIADAQFERLLRVLEPVIESFSPTLRNTTVPIPRIAIDGSGPVATRLAELLSDQPAVSLVSTDPDGSDGRPVDFAVLCADFVVPPSRYARWLRDDVPHLPIVSSDRSVIIGPFVTPGAGPCLYCVDLQRTDQDETWPTVAAQLLGRASPLDAGLLCSEVAARAARLLLRRVDERRPLLSATQLVTDAVTGGIKRRVVREHSKCACRALPGSATVPAGRRAAAPRPTTG